MTNTIFFVTYVFGVIFGNLGAQLLINQFPGFNNAMLITFSKQFIGNLWLPMLVLIIGAFLVSMIMTFGYWLMALNEYVEVIKAMPNLSENQRSALYKEHLKAIIEDKENTGDDFYKALTNTALTIIIDEKLDEKPELELSSFTKKMEEIAEKGRGWKSFMSLSLTIPCIFIACFFVGLVVSVLILC